MPSPLNPDFPLSAARPMAPDLDRPITATSNSDAADHSAHSRSRSTAHTQNPRRLSVFTSGRSRSNTTTSSMPLVASSRRPPVSSMTSAETAPLPPAHEGRRGSAAGVRHERHESVTKSLLLRGSRILRRQGSKANIVATLNEEEEMEREKSRSGRHHRCRPTGSHEQMKRMISEPFDFHHLTHTSPAQFHELDRARQTDLVTEFSAIRASQKPVTNLKGIRAEDLQSVSVEDLARCFVEHDVASPPVSPGARPISPRQQDRRARRESRIMENFSRPASIYHRTDAPSSPPRAASPRASSPRPASSDEIPEPSPRVIDAILGLNSPQTYPEHIYSTDEDSRQGSLTDLNIEAMFSTDFGHAITTGIGADCMDARTASPLTSPASELENVPEEDEATHGHDNLLPQPLASPVLNSQPSSDPVSTRRNVTEAPKSRLSINMAKDLSEKFTVPLGSPTLPLHRSDGAAISKDDGGIQTTLRRHSSVVIHETIYESWDDDIDYCYEHAAEANSNFDWGRTSLDEKRRSDIEVTVTVSDLPASLEALSMDISPNPRHPSSSVTSTPELDPSPSRSAPSSRLPVTPLSSVGYEGELVNQKDNDFFNPFSPSELSGGPTKHITPDALYEDYLVADADSDRHFPFFSQGSFQTIEHPVSPGSSFSPISKCNSQESLILSRAASIVRKHRSSVSTTSVPDLVHSLASSRDFSVSDLMLPGEQPGLVRQDSTSHSSISSQHRQSRSVARETENQTMSHPDSNSSTDLTKPISRGASVNDRAKSISDAETAQSAIKPGSPAKTGHRKRGRNTSYSLFPHPPTLPTAATS
ncbi:hypothetical protein BJX61DRAFT_547525 [Aspergillus egyptiacus]|nr:hypothetical protein BJX61DRAFT_547525 [Aspergillus egyptiacus]